MNVRNHGVAILIGIAGVTLAVTTATSMQLFAGMTSAVEDGQFELMQATVESKLRNTEGRATSRAHMLADSHPVRRLLAARDRDGLNAEIHDLYETQHDQFGLAVLGFQIPPAVMFLRAHRPESFGEDLSSYRPIVVAVNADHAPRSGIILSRSGISIGAIVPVQGPDGAHAGTVEVGIDLGPMVDDLDESFDLQATFYVLETPLREIATNVDPSVLADDNRVGDYLKWYSTNWALAQELVRPADLAGAQEPVRYTREANGVPYGVLLYPVTTAAGDPIGVLAVARDFSPTRAATGRSLVWQALLALFALIVIAGAVIVVIRGLLLRPLDRVAQAMEALAQGEAAPPIPDVDAMPSELQRIAKHHESLRSKAAVKTLYGSGESS